MNYLSCLRNKLIIEITHKSRKTLKLKLKLYLKNEIYSIKFAVGAHYDWSAPEETAT